MRKGNPKNIKGFKDLAKSGVKVLVTHGAGQVGMWEDIAGRTENKKNQVGYKFLFWHFNRYRN